ncbi:Glutamate N-acetyltransferase @ N-acetylglutamate synthase [hydrothermal vent metagenome]|uniref:glutamate N-acetyltransferase n=1 Tax=hydrothermal vent metagenome TaxID=652676 RepID=A0A3B1CH51_9ZZZZ
MSNAKRSGVTAPKGFMAAGGACGVKPDGSFDLALIASDRPAVAWGVFTKNVVKGAPVIVSKENLRSKTSRVIVVNSGNANVLAENDYKNAKAMAQTAAEFVGCAPREAFVASTGVIGQPLPIEKVLKGIETIAPYLRPSGGKDAAKAIMTTDLAAKEAQAELKIGSKDVLVGGVAKGSGMIHPSMATMLAFVTTDAAISRPVLKKLVKEANEASFNRITVDGDTSTSDMLLVMANGASGAELIDKPSGQRYAKLLSAVTSVCVDLARKVVKDGEGATKFVSVKVTSAKTEKAAKSVAMSIARSSLVKTALFGEDANWGRILCAAGYAGVNFDPSKISLNICGKPVFQNGKLVSADWEKKVAPLLKKRDVEISLDLGGGNASAEVWTCDLSHDYIRINTEYRN